MPESAHLIVPPVGAAPADMCSRCGSRPATVEPEQDDAVCDDCASLYYTCCPGCELWYRDDSSCVDCVSCGRCAAVVPADDTVDTVAGTAICVDCRHAFYWQCPSCEGWNRDGYDCGNEHHDDEDYGCDCGDCRGGRHGSLFDSGYKPVPRFYGVGPLFLGCEIELEAPYARTEECIGVADDRLGEIGYLKEDGSLHNGFEIVTHPMSYPWALANFPWTMLTDLAGLGCTVNRDTGLHVHLSRAGFASSCHIFRWMKLIYRNQRQVEVLARRASNNWSAFTDYDRRAAKAYAKGGAGGRYQAINPNNRDTFELRVFASSLEPSQVQAALAFAAASVQYTRTLTVRAVTRAGGWTWPVFVSWLRQHPAYAPLTTQLEALGCVC